MKSFLLLPLLVSAALSAHIDLSSYPLSVELRPNTYTLYWGFDVSAQTIRFAVNVRTTGWVGLGLSPTGGMPNSDIVIGWVNDQGEPLLHDRFATVQGLPTVDSSQDWILEAGEQENGFTTLAFRRDWVTCDSLQDRNITTDTTRVIYAWNDADPSNDAPNSVMYHGQPNRGTLSVNLLGGQQNPPPEPADVMSFDARVDDIQVPSGDTTYWCSVTELPQNILSQTHYITRVAPVIQAGNELHVHHILIYECDTLDSSHVGYSAQCGSGGTIGNMVQQCLQSTLIVGWAVGGGDFVYPADVAYPVGGAGNPRYFVAQTHYDNPNLRSDIMDSSGMRFFYTSTARSRDAGILEVGQVVSRFMIIPPGAELFSQFGECSSQCTGSQIPPGGIFVFANTLHTHLAGVSATLRHLRPDTNCGNGFRELKPIDQNLQYDFNFQQANFLPEVVHVMPGDIIRMECNYRTDNRTGVALGGESTNEEMCLSFLNYYPRIDLSLCLTNIPFQQGSYQPFLSRFVTQEQLDAIVASAQQSQGQFEAALNALNWSSEAVDSLQTSITNGPYRDNCFVQGQGSTSQTFPAGLQAADPQCVYQAPDICDGSTGLPSVPGGSAAFLVPALFTVLTLCLLVLNL